jgi:hypothetical protein
VIEEKLAINVMVKAYILIRMLLLEVAFLFDTLGACACMYSQTGEKVS